MVVESSAAIGGCQAVIAGDSIEKVWHFACGGMRNCALALRREISFQLSDELFTDQ